MKKPKVQPPVYFLIALLATPVLHFLLPIIKIIPSPWNLAGILFILAGLAIGLPANRLFHRVGTTVVPGAQSQVLVTSGAFRITRNPMYLSFAMLLFGVAVLFGTLTPLLVAPVFMLLIGLRFIPMEEVMLDRQFGQAYQEYKKRVRRWV